MKLYEFSVPMPYHKEHIDKIISINNEIEKSRITSLYFSLPVSCDLYTGFENKRFNHQISDFNYWKELMKYSIFNGFDFIYLLNSPLMSTSFSYQEQIKRLELLINELKKIGVNKFRISHIDLIYYLHKNHPEFELYTSRTFDFKTIGEYENFIYNFPYIKGIVISPDNNKNFMLLKNLVKKYPEIEFEIMVNEGCIKDCSIRKFHLMQDEFQNKNSMVYNEYCIKKFESNRIENIFKASTIIYPWEISEYKKIGINKFKIAGRDNPKITTGEIIEYYLIGIENSNLILTKPIKYFSNWHIFRKDINYTVKDLKPYLPNIKHFVKYGHLCSSACGINCNYCFTCSKKVESVKNKKRKS